MVSSDNLWRSADVSDMFHTFNFKCFNCKMEKSQCLNGQHLKESFEFPVGLRIITSGNSWQSSYLDKIGNIVSCKQTSVFKPCMEQAH